MKKYDGFLSGRQSTIITQDKNHFLIFFTRLYSFNSRPGACGGELACSTCHLIFDEVVYDTLPPKSDEEEDMLDLAFELTETSRLGCQICVTKELDGIKVRIPDDGY